MPGIFGSTSNVGGIKSINNTFVNEAVSGSGTKATDWEQNDMPEVLVSCSASGNGTLFFDFSNDDGTTVTSTFPSSGFKVTGGIHEFHKAIKGPRAFKLRFVDTSGAENTVSVSTWYGIFGNLNAPLNQSLGADADATVVRSLPPVIDLSTGALGGIESKDKFGFIYGS